MQRVTEANIHAYGKMIFEDAEGQTIRVPEAPSPRFSPPKTFTVKRVDIEREVPWAGHNGRRPDILLTSPEGTKLVVEIKNSNGKAICYGEDLEQAGLWLALEIDVAPWKDNKLLRPDFTNPAMLQSVIDQATWLVPGKPRPMSWKPYGMVVGRCSRRSRDCDFLRNDSIGEPRFGQDGMPLDEGVLRVRYGSPWGGASGRPRKRPKPDPSRDEI